MFSWNWKCLEFLHQLHFKNLQIDGVVAHDASLCMYVGVLVINYAESHSSYHNLPPPHWGPGGAWLTPVDVYSFRLAVTYTQCGYLPLRLIYSSLRGLTSDYASLLWIYWITKLHHSKHMQISAYIYVASLNFIYYWHYSLLVESC